MCRLSFSLVVTYIDRVLLSQLKHCKEGYMLSQSDRSLTLKPVHRPSMTSGMVALSVNGPDCQDFY